MTVPRVVLILEVTDPHDQEDLAVLLHYLGSHNLSRTARATGRDRKTIVAALARMEALLRFSLRGTIDRRPSPTGRLVTIGENSPKRP